jgi:hypothetical protein
LGENRIRFGLPLGYDDPQVQIPCSLEEFPCYAPEISLFPLRREFVGKPLNWLVD